MTTQTDTAAEIRQLIAAYTAQLQEARDAEAAAGAVVETARARNALEGPNPDTRAVLNKALRVLESARTFRLDTDAAIKSLEGGLEHALAADNAEAASRWREVARVENTKSDDDQWRTREMLVGMVDALEAEELRLKTAKREAERLSARAAGDGVSIRIRSARPLTDDHRAFVGLLESLNYLAGLRARPN